MNKQYFEKVFSTDRMQKYFERYPSSESKAMLHYHINIKLSESFYPLISIFEVAYRNSINRELCKYFDRDSWYEDIRTTPGLNSLNRQIDSAKKHILKRKEKVKAPKVVAELTLGFWVKLLNAEYEQTLWRPLRKAFPYLEKKERQRNKVSAPINKIRNFRNRVFHHEPISWNLSELEKIHDEIIKVAGWLNKDLPDFMEPFDRVPNTILWSKKKLEK